MAKNKEFLSALPTLFENYSPIGEQFTQQVAADSDNEISQQVAAELFTVSWGRRMMDGGRG